MIYNKLIFLALVLFIAGCGLTQQQIERRESYLSRAEFYFQNQKYRNAWQQIEHALEIDPKNKRALISKGWTLIYLEKYDLADDAFQKAYQLDDTDPWLHYGMGTVAFKRGSIVEGKMAQAINSAFLFGINSEYWLNCEQGKITREMKAEFAKNGFSLSAKVTVEIKKEHTECLIKDKEKKKTYLLVRVGRESNGKKEETLNIYSYDSYEEKLEKYKSEKEAWYVKSLDHFHKSQHINSGNRELYKMIALAYAARGTSFYLQAIESLDRYIQFLNEESMLFANELDLSKEQRKKNDIKEKEKEELDTHVEKLKLEQSENRRQYCIFQSMAAEWYAQLATMDKQKTTKKMPAKEKKKLLIEMHNYINEGRQRLNAILATSPHLSNHYLNQAYLAKLEDKNDLELGYLQQYLQNCPLGDYKLRVKVKEQIELLGKKEKDNGS